jgi:CBS domain-containing protein
MKVSEIMTRSVITVRVDTPVREASTLLTEHRITSMPVLGNDGGVVGIVSELDLLRGRIPQDPRAHLNRHVDQRPDPGRFVGDVMTDTVVCMSENADVADVAELMITNRVRAVPIISGAGLVGIVSRRDLLRTLLREDVAIRAEVLARLATYADPKERYQVEVADGVVTIREHFEDERRCQAAIALIESVPGVIRVHARGRSHH